ncbi:DUF4097 domain-containing protein [Myxococcota bacterium]|nr:DUF4097 domain-containing protein [Myxococcota bacterium]
MTGRIAPRTALLSLIACVLLGDVASGQPPPDEFRVDDFQWTGDLSPSQVLRVHNPFGDIRARSSGDDRLSVAAMIQRFSRDQTDARIEIHQDRTPVEIEIHYPSATRPGPDGRKRGRIDLALLVPPGVRLEISTDHGNIEAKGVDRPLLTHSQSGDLRVSTSRPVDARTGSGRINATLRSPDPGEPDRFATQTGDIRVDFPKSGDVGVEARTRGSIVPHGLDESRFRLSHDGESSVLQLGSGSPAIRVESNQGTIDLHAMNKYELR